MRCILTVTTVSVLVNGPLGIISLRLFFNLTLTLQMIPECFASRKSPGCLRFPAGHILYYYTVSQIGTRFGPVFFRHFTVLQRHVKGTDRSWVPGECQVEKQVGCGLLQWSDHHCRQNAIRFQCPYVSKKKIGSNHPFE